MFNDSVKYPFNFVNRRGIPLIESSSVTTDDTNAIINISNNAFRFLETRGIFLFRLNTEIPTAAATLPIIFSWTGLNGQSRTQSLTIVGGDPATATQLSGTGVYIIYYDKSANILQLISVGNVA